MTDGNTNILNHEKILLKIIVILISLFVNRVSFNTGYNNRKDDTVDKYLIKFVFWTIIVIVIFVFVFVFLKKYNIFNNYLNVSIILLLQIYLNLSYVTNDYLAHSYINFFHIFFVNVSFFYLINEIEDKDKTKIIYYILLIPLCIIPFFIKTNILKNYNYYNLIKGKYIICKEKKYPDEIYSFKK